MTTFIASNGIAIRAHTDQINVDGHWITTAQVQAISEFIGGQAEAAPVRPWVLAKPGDCWLLTEKKGQTRPWTKLANGEWAAVDGCDRNCVLTDNHFVTGNALWKKQ